MTDKIMPRLRKVESNADLEFAPSDECSCDPVACGHGNYSKCGKCNKYTRLEDMHFHEKDNKEYCGSCYDLIDHAEKHGRAIDIWEAKNVE